MSEANHHEERPKQYFPIPFCVSECVLVLQNLFSYLHFGFVADLLLVQFGFNCPVGQGRVVRSVIFFDECLYPTCLSLGSRFSPPVDDGKQALRRMLLSPAPPYLPLFYMEIMS